MKIVRVLYTTLAILSFNSLMPGTVVKANTEQFQIEESFVAGVEKAFDFKEFIENNSYKFDLEGYTITKINIREEPSLESNIIDTLVFNTKIKFSIYDDNWLVIEHNGKHCYVAKKYVSTEANKYNIVKIPENSGFKSYMSYTAITNKTSNQYELQLEAHTGNYGIRMVDDRYCVVVGSYFNKKVGDYFDLILENGTIIKCVLGDVKSSVHTLDNDITSFNGCVSEFIIDNKYLHNDIKTSGNISMANKLWDSPVKEIKFYKKNHLN